MQRASWPRLVDRRRWRLRWRLLSALAVLAVLCTITSPPQAAAQRHDTRGHRFWVAFLESLGAGGYGEVTDMRLYAASDSVALVTVRFNLTGATLQVPLPTPGVPVEIDLTAAFGSALELDPRYRVSHRSLEVTSDREITLYGVSVRSMSADAFLGLPDDVLTRRTIVLAYPNGFLRSSDGFGRYDTPSEFCVIATEDGTLVRVDPSTLLTGWGDTVFTVGLDKGQVLFAQAATGEARDVSGTEIRATKPVAVFGGTRRSSIPVAVGDYRDHLVEQIPPLEVWGREAVVAPLFPVTPRSNQVGIVRVLAAFDNTTWSVNGVAQAPLNAARSIELPAATPLHITASAPILVAQYEHSVGTRDAQGGYDIGDPFMMVVPPPEQFDSSYSFQSIGHPEFLRHFINVVVPAGSESSVRLDGQTLGLPGTPIPGTPYVYIQHELDAGAHRISADRAFGLYAYGYGRATSYGYTGGMLFRTLVHDFQPPELDARPECGTLVGIAYDSRITDDGVDSCYALPDTRNARVTVEPFTSGADTVRFTARLADPYRDGLASVRVIDGGGRSRTQRTPIPGYTLRAVASPGGAPVVLDSLVVFNAMTACHELDIVNDGAYPHTIDQLRFDPIPDGMTMSPALPQTIPPGGSLRLAFCIALSRDTAVRFRISIADSCVAREVAIAPVLRMSDTLAPSPAISGDVCEHPLRITVREGASRGSGIARIAVEPVANARFVAQDPLDLGGGVQEVTVSAELIDEHYDGVLRIVAEDRAGNQASFLDTIPGFTLAVLDRARDSAGVRFARAASFGPVAAGSFGCEPITVVNYGGRPLRLSRVSTTTGRWISIPPAQLPVTVPARSEITLDLCLEAGGVGLLEDELVLVDECERLERVAIRLAVDQLTASGVDRCGSQIALRSAAAARRTYLTTPVPNPTSGDVLTVDVALDGDELVTLTLQAVDASGTWTVLDATPLAAGLHRVTIDIAALPSGAYLARLTTRKAADTKPFIVRR